MRTFIIFFVSYFGVLNGMDMFYMDDHCGSTIDMFTMTDEYYGRLSVHGSYVGDCNVTIKASYDKRLLFYFDEFHLGTWKTNYCPKTFLTVYYGQNPELQILYNICGTWKVHGINYTSNSNNITFRYFNTDTTNNNNHFDIIVTAFNKSSCLNFDGIDLCVDGSHRSTGYSSDSGTNIIYIIIGLVFFFVAFSSLPCFISKCIEYFF